MQHDVLIGEIEAWLIDETLVVPDIVTLFKSLCTRLHGVGLPLDRAAVSWPTLHPLFTAEQIFWRRGEEAELFQYPHGPGPGEGYLASPFHHAHRNGLTRLRRRLSGPESLVDFPVLEELRGKGFTDYLLTATRMNIGRVEEYLDQGVVLMASWATRREGGFSGDDIVALSRIQKLFAVACHASIQMRVMEALAGAYLGPHAARHVLSGDTRLGDGERLRAVVWLSDLRGSTWLSGAMDPEDYLAYLSKYYACTAEPVIDAGGDIIDFIGDAVLAVFPLDGDAGAPEAAAAATRAMDAALDRLAAYRRAEGTREMQFSIALAMGEIMFGNIGVPARLSFSAIGSAINVVSRLDALSKSVGRAVLATEDVARLAPERWAQLGRFDLPGLDDALPVYAPADGRDAFDNATLRLRLRDGLAAEKRFVNRERQVWRACDRSSLSPCSPPVPRPRRGSWGPTPAGRRSRVGPSTSIARTRRRRPSA